MKRRIAFGYFAVSIAALLLGFGPISLVAFFLWIVLGPISFLGFADARHGASPIATEMFILLRGCHTDSGRPPLVHAKSPWHY